MTSTLLGLLFLTAVLAVYGTVQIRNARRILRETAGAQEAAAEDIGHYSPGKAAIEAANWGPDKFDLDGLRKTILNGHHMSWKVSFWLIQQLELERAPVDDGTEETDR